MKSFLRKNIWRIATTLILVIAGWVVRQAMAPDIKLIYHLFSSLIVIVGTQVVWGIQAGIHKLLNKWLPFSTYLYLRVIVQLCAGLLAMYLLRLLIFGVFFPNAPVSLALVTLINSLVSILVNLALMSEQFTAWWVESQVRAERLEKEKVQVQYLHLKNQVDPHFLFNALTSLDSLVKTEPDLASQFIGHMAKVYRYALQNRDREVVSLHTELSFLEHYISLQKIRFGPALGIDIQIDKMQQEKGIAMVSLQMLIDNAIKHNEIHAEYPLRISIFVEGDYLYVRNNKQVRRQLLHSDKRGLQQMTQLYTFLTDRPVLVRDEIDTFTVALPLL